MVFDLMWHRFAVRIIRGCDGHHLLPVSVVSGFEPVLARVDRDRVEPRGKAGIEPEASQGPEDLYEGFLGAIVSLVVVTQEPVAQIENLVLIAQDQPVEHVLVAGQESPDAS